MTAAQRISTIALLAVATFALQARGDYRDDSRAIKVSGGEDHTLVLTADKGVWVCGPNGGHDYDIHQYYYGVLGVGSDEYDLDQKTLIRVHGPNDVNYLEDINDIDSGWLHSLALEGYDPCDPNLMGYVWSWGWNSWGQLGIGNDDPRTSPVRVFRGDQPGDPCNPNDPLKYIIAISAGRSGEFSLAVDANGYVYGWGRNDAGQLGNGKSGDYEKELTPVYVCRGEQPGDPCDPNRIEHIIAISAGAQHGMALEDYDPLEADLHSRVYTWGDNYFAVNDGNGVLGHGIDSSSSTPVLVLRGQQDYNEPNHIYLKDIVAISAGWEHCMALEKYEVYDSYLDATDPNYTGPDPNHKGRVYTWGNNGQGWRGWFWERTEGGRLGDGSTTNRNTPVLVLRGEQPTEDPNDLYLSRIRVVSAGEGHSMAVDANGYVYCWGDNYYGQLGDGTTDQSLVPVRVVGEDGEGYLENVVTIAAGYWHSIAVDANGAIWTWGKGSDGRLGLANKTIDCNTPHRIPVVYNITQETFQFAIQPAIDEANDVNDILEASVGTYYENVNFRDKSVTLRSAAPSDWDVVAETIVGAMYNSGYYDRFYAAVDFNDGSGSIVAGLTLTNGHKNGVMCEYVNSATIINCSIQNNDWNGIYSDHSSVNITGCEIRANASDDDDYCGIYAEAGSDVNVAMCVIADNDANGISCYQSTATIINCTVEDNGGYGIQAKSNCDLAIAQSLIKGNGKSGVYALTGCDFVLDRSIVCDNGWDGVDLEYNNPETLTNNWIYNNGRAAYLDYQDGVWFKNYQTSVPLVRNNTIFGNPTYGINVFSEQTDPNILNCIIYGNGDGELKGRTLFDVTFSCIEDGYTGQGNISSDPCFMDADANDFHLAANSPCIDTGDPDLEPDANETDIDGEERVINGRVDMGADEFYWSAADYSGDGIVNFVDYAMLTSYWEDSEIDYNDVFGRGDGNSVSLDVFCDEWLWQAGWLTGPMPLMAGRGGEGMAKGLGLEFAPYELVTAEPESVITEPVDIKKMLAWLAEIWLDPEVREGIGAENWLKLYESLEKELENQ
jgi:alpha-tubulin suppressor-like RCC1 family protein